MVSDGDGGFYVRGRVNGERVIALLAADGTISWSHDTDFRVSSIRSLPGSGGASPDHLLVAGYRSYGTGDPEFRGVLALYDASGQALQNMNLMFGLPETTGLEQQPLFP